MNKIFTFFREFSLASFLAPVGIFLIIFSGLTYKAVDNTKNWPTATAIVTQCELYEDEHYDPTTESHVEASYDIWIKYTVDDVEHEVYYGVMSNIKVGDEITICYNPENFEEVGQPTGFILPTIILIVGVAALAGAICNIIFVLKKQKQLKLQEESWKNEQ